MPKLLVIDDERSVLHVFRRVLENQDDVQLLIAGAGKDGVRIVKESRPDAVIIDLMLPDAPGLDVYAKIRELDPKLPVVFITAGGTAATAIEAMQQGGARLSVQAAGLCTGQSDCPASV